MPRYLLHHSHGAQECAASFAAWRGFSSDLRHAQAISSCRYGGHEIWWDVEAATPDQALGLLPAYVAERTRITRVAALEIR